MDTDEDEHPIMEFELPLHGGPSVDLFELHSYLFEKLQLNQDDKLLLRIFYMMAALCDPMTQPGENGSYQLSVRGLADTATALGYQILLEMRHEAQNSDDEVPFQLAPIQNADLINLKFTLSLKFFEIIQAINILLRAEDELRVRHLQIDEEIDWSAVACYWLPKLDGEDEDQPLKTLYYMCCTIIVSIYLMYKNSSIGISPYTDYFLRLWKTHSSIIQLGLEVDRLLEEEAWSKRGEYFDTPEIVKRALMGSSAVRTVLAVVLEDFFVANTSDTLRTTYQMAVHDLESLSILDFFDPLCREMVGGGSLHNKVDNIAVAMVVLRLHTDFSPCYPVPSSNIEKELWSPEYPTLNYDQRNRDSTRRSDPAGLSCDLVEETYYDDKLDDDVKYVFGHYDSEEESSSEAGQETDFPMALRKDKDDIEFDERGRDWRDQVRGSNVNLTPEFKALLDEFTANPLKEGSDHFFSNFDEIEEGLRVFTLLEIEYMPKFLQHVGQSLLNTVAYAATRALEGDHDLIDRIHVFLVSPADPDLLAEALQQKPFLIQRRYITVFELILVFNSNTACALMDELLMVNGLRRLIIWFLCHSVNLHMLLINHVYELVAGYRGNSSKRNSPYKFSRQGALQLSPVEQLMLLHEFFINSGPWLVSEFGEIEEDHQDVPALRAEKIVLCLCLMILKLIDEKIIVLSQDHQDDFEDYSQDLKVLLFPWIGRVLEARHLYFEVTRIKNSETPTEKSQELTSSELANETNYRRIVDTLNDLGLLDKVRPKFAALSHGFRQLADAGALSEDGLFEDFFDMMGIKQAAQLVPEIPASDVSEGRKSESVITSQNRADTLTNKKQEEYDDGLAASGTWAEHGQMTSKGFTSESIFIAISIEAYGGEIFPGKVPSAVVFDLFRDYIEQYPVSSMDVPRMLKFLDLMIIGENQARLRARSLHDVLGDAYLKDMGKERAPESEFNDEFLNGEGKFQEKLDKQKKKKKKKAKKKKK